MKALAIEGGKPLSGTVEICGAKNAVLPLLAATVLHGGIYQLHHCPDITDVSLTCRILELLGGQVTRSGHTLTVDTRQLNGWTIPDALMCRMRASVLFLGPLLARFGRAAISMPGGCPLGRRPIDLHLEALAQMGTSVTLLEGEIRCEAPALHGCVIDLPFPSVGATENILMAATACRGTVVLNGAAREPEIGDLIRFLQSMGGDLRTGDEGVTIVGGAPLHAAEHTVLPDRIETATYLCAAAACGGDLLLTGTDGNLLQPILEALVSAGCGVCQHRDTISLRAGERLQAIGTIQTMPYPGFPTDAQALLMAALLRAEGQTQFAETIFEQRFSHVPQLRRFGAQIRLVGSTALVRGVSALQPAHAEAYDLRAAAALIIAALQAPGKSKITGLKHLHRGYDDLEGKLRRLGAEIQEYDWKSASM